MWLRVYRMAIRKIAKRPSFCNIISNSSIASHVTFWSSINTIDDHKWKYMPMLRHRAASDLLVSFNWAATAPYSPCSLIRSARNNELSGHRNRAWLRPAWSFQPHTPIAGRISFSDAAVVIISPSTQDQHECAGNLEAGGSAGNWKGFVQPQKVIVSCVNGMISLNLMCRQTWLDRDNSCHGEARFWWFEEARVATDNAGDYPFYSISTCLTVTCSLGTRQLCRRPLTTCSYHWRPFNVHRKPAWKGSGQLLKESRLQWMKRMHKRSTCSCSLQSVLKSNITPLP